MSVYCRYAELEASCTSLQQTNHALEETVSEIRAQGELLRMELEHEQQRAGTASESRSAPGRVSWQSGVGTDSRQAGHPRNRGSEQDHSRGSSRSGGYADTHTGAHAGNNNHTVDGTRFEESVGGGLATSTPVHYALHPPQTAQQAIEEKNTLIGLYQVNLRSLNSF